MNWQNGSTPRPADRASSSTWRARSETEALPLEAVVDLGVVDRHQLALRPVLEDAGAAVVGVDQVLPDVGLVLDPHPRHQPFPLAASAPVLVVITSAAPPERTRRTSPGMTMRATAASA